ncbi:CLUMA_CG011025, isoform A [Clunio marinus]|uniref:CLUMA_CG011025, isoform A n=1 Tax=Clunio marinus TaxID=568069 RepID=A0A1J1IBI5_9DIPT|nr:CLUMA_CG011025, isoform A [Clunio marinus]
MQGLNDFISWHSQEFHVCTLIKVISSSNIKKHKLIEIFPSLAWDTFNNLEYLFTVKHWQH